MERMTTYISVPPGIDDNEMMILRDAGNSINGLKGDIKIGIKVVNDTAFKRNGMDLIYKKTITLKEALCGVEFDIQHLNGKILSLKNTANMVIISPNFQKVVPNYGMKRENNTGNLIIVFDIAFPETLTEEQVQKLNEVL
jgi:DnaJ-class molecular chaperone